MAARPARRARSRLVAGVRQVIEVDGYARNRYRGGAMGRKSARELDAGDLGMVIAELVAAREQLIRAYRIIDRHERRAAVAVALGKVGLATRWADEIVLRRGVAAGDMLAA